MNNLSTQPKPSLPDALRRYWHHLAGVILFPTAVFVGVSFLHVPSVVFALLFFPVWFYSVWPAFSRRAPSSFGWVALAAWGGGIILVSLLVFLLVLVWPSAHRL